MNRPKTLLIRNLAIGREFPCHESDLQSVKDVIELNSSINLKYGTFEETLLHLASRRNLISIVKYLLESGADPNIHDKNNIGPLHDALMENYFDVAKCLVMHGADVDAFGRLGNTILHDAVRLGYTSVITFVLDQGIDKNKRNDTGETAWDIAIAQGSHDAAAYIQSYEPVPTKGVNYD